MVGASPIRLEEEEEGEAALKAETEVEAAPSVQSLLESK